MRLQIFGNAIRVGMRKMGDSGPVGGFAALIPDSPPAIHRKDQPTQKLEYAVECSDDFTYFQGPETQISIGGGLKGKKAGIFGDNPCQMFSPLQRAL
jgi:hypothetical protein